MQQAEEGLRHLAEAGLERRPVLDQGGDEGSDRGRLPASGAGLVGRQWRVGFGDEIEVVEGDRGGPRDRRHRRVEDRNAATAARQRERREFDRGAQRAAARGVGRRDLDQAGIEGRGCREVVDEAGEGQRQVAEAALGLSCAEARLHETAR